MQPMDDLIWKMFDTFHVDFPEEPVASMERFSPMRFYREKHVFRMGDFSNRIIELANVTELPTGSILHILDDVSFPEAHSDLPRVADNIFLQKESFQKKYIYHMRDLDLEGPVHIEDKFIFRPAGLPSIFMKFRSEHKAFFRYLNTLAEMPRTKECLVVVNHNPLFRTRLFGRYQFFRRMQLILASILNTTHKLQHLDKQQFIQIPWGENVFDKQLFVRTRAKLDPITFRRPDSFHFIMMMHLLNFMWEESNTSIFRQLPAEDFRQLNLIIQLNDKYIFFNLADLLRLNEKNRAHTRFCNQLNTLSLTGRITEATSTEVKAEAEKFIKKVSEDEAPKTDETTTAETSIVKEEYVPRIVDGAPAEESTPPEKVDVTTDVKAEEVIRKAAAVIPLIKPAVPKTVVSVEIPHTHAAVKETKAGSVKEIPNKVILNATAIRSADTSKDVHVHEYIQEIDTEAASFIDAREELTPKEKNRYKLISQKYKSLQLGGESLDVILKNNSDMTLEDDDIDPKQVGDLPDPSSLKSSLAKFDKTYMDKTFKKHLIGAAISFQKTGIFLTGIKETKEVSEMNNVTHYSLHYEDIEGRQSTVKFRFPTVDAEGKVLIDGVKQVLKKQRVALPIVKISDTEISLASNQNKTRVIRNENKAHNFFSFIDSLLNSQKSTAVIEFGSCQVNLPLSYEYSSLADRYKKVSFKNKENYEFYFDYKTRLTHFGGTAEVLQKLEKVYGVYTGSTSLDWLFIDNQNKIRAVKKSGGEELDFPYSSYLEIFRLSLREGETFTKTLSEWISIKILDKQLPVIFVLAYRYGLRNVLDYMGLKYTVTERRNKTIVGEGGLASIPEAYPEMLGMHKDMLAGQEDLKELGLTTITGGYFYHVTGTDLGEKIQLTPRVPSVYKRIEEDKTARISVSNSVEGCLIGVPEKGTIPDPKTGKPKFRKYVYAVNKASIPNAQMISNSEIIRRRLVWDANVTEEAWILQATEFRKIGVVEGFAGDDDVVTIYYKPLKLMKFMKDWDVYCDNGYLKQYAVPYTWVEGKDPAGGSLTYDPKKNYKKPSHLKFIIGQESLSIDACPILTLDYMKTFWDTVLQFYKVKYGFDLAYMKYEVTDTPHNQEGQPTNQVSKEQFGGCWTKNKKVYFNKELRKAMAFYKKTNMLSNIQEFESGVTLVTAHELAHEIYTNLASSEFKKKILSLAEKENFSTEYLQSLDTTRANYTEEIFCEYLATQAVMDGLTSQVISDDKRYSAESNDIAIKFADRTLWINRYPLAHSLVVAGLEAFDLTMHDLASFESKDVYFQILQEKKCSANYLKGIDAFFDTFVDNMTFSTLKMMNEPTSVRDLLLRCATLLSTLDYRPPSSRLNFRIRGYEQFNAVLYNEMARQYAAYKTRRGKANTFSINPDAVFLRIIQNASMVPSESVNPLQDIKEQSYMTYAGIGGRTADSFVVTDRKYSTDDIGVISESTVDNQKVGINAQLSMDPGIINTMGVLEPKPLDELKPANVLSVHSLVFPFATHDD